MSSYYEMPKSNNMLSHLTNAQALKDYKYEESRKLIRKQEELLRNLSKVRSEMEQEESQIGKTKDYYSGSRKDKFEHTLDRADKLRNKRFAEKEVESIVKAASEEAKQPVWSPKSAPERKSHKTSKMISFTPTSSNVPVIDSALDVYGGLDKFRADDAGNKYISKYSLGAGCYGNQSNIDKLKDQVENIANRYHTESVVDDGLSYHYYQPEYYPGSCYVKAMSLSDGSQGYVSGPELAQYFPVTRYVLY